MVSPLPMRSSAVIMAFIGVPVVFIGIVVVVVAAFTVFGFVVVAEAAFTCRELMLLSRVVPATVTVGCML